MREIEFRAWDSENICHKMSIGRKEFFDDMLAFRFNHFDQEPENIIFEQYTGLLDKNGKKIFEGDILKGAYEGARVGVIQFARGIYGINWDYKYNQDPEWVGGNMYGSWGHLHNLRPLDDGHINTMIIIGNIHENADLLEDK